jgi:hypothetical protein
MNAIGGIMLVGNPLGLVSRESLELILVVLTEQHRRTSHTDQR